MRYHNNKPLPTHYLPVEQSDDDLGSKHHSEIPEVLPTKKDTTKDLLLMFSDRLTVVFKLKGGETETLTGQWCLICK